MTELSQTTGRGGWGKGKGPQRGEPGEELSKLVDDEAVPQDDSQSPESLGKLHSTLPQSEEAIVFDEALGGPIFDTTRSSEAIQVLRISVDEHATINYGIADQMANLEVRDLIREEEV
jgi:hypothetical protein